MHLLMVSEDTPESAHALRPIEYPAEGHIVTPAQIANILIPFFLRKRQEYFLTVTLSGSGEILSIRVITVGLLNHSLVHPREVFRDAIIESAASIILVHNHPSRTLDASEQDKAITMQLKAAGDIIGIRVLDHVIIAGDQFVSFRERGLI
jgi:DNA repair protein RadC